MWEGICCRILCTFFYDMESCYCTKLLRFYLFVCMKYINCVGGPGAEILDGIKASGSKNTY